MRVVDRHDRLVVGDQLGGNRAPQGRLELQVVAAALPPSAGHVQLWAAAAASLRLVHGVVATPQKLLWPHVRGAGQCHADACAQDDVAVVDRNRPCERLDDAVPDAERVAVAVEVLAQDGELIAAEPGHGVMGSDGRADPHRRLAQCGIAGGMAEAVVDALEAVDVDEQDGNASLRVPPPPEGVLEAVIEERPVR